MSNSPAARTVFAILEVGFEAAEEGMSRSCLWLCWGGIGVFSRSTWQRKVSCISGCIDEWGQRRSLWGLWKCLSFVIKFRPLCRIFCEHSQLPKPPLPCLAGVYAIVIVTLSWRRCHHHYHRHYPYHCYAYQLPYNYPLHYAYPIHKRNSMQSLQQDEKIHGWPVSRFFGGLWFWRNRGAPNMVQHVLPGPRDVFGSRWWCGPPAMRS